MIQSLYFLSEKKNLYLYDHKLRLSMLVHPELKKAHEKSIVDDQYYVKKHEYLTKHGFFSNPEPIKFGTLDESMVRESIRQTAQITFEITDFCNLNCTYCSFGDLYEGFDERNFKNIDINSAIKLIKYIFELQPKNKKKKLAIGFYGGEPLHNAEAITQIINVIDELRKEKELDIEYNMTTNATLIHNNINILVKNNIRLLVSLDGNESNHSYRPFKNGKSSFQKVINNLDMVRKEFPDYFQKFVHFNAVLHNKNSVEEIYEYIFNRYNKIPRITVLASDNVRQDKKHIHMKMFHSKRTSEKLFERSSLAPIMHNELSIYKELTNFLKYYSINFYISNIITLLQVNEKYLPTNTCLPGQKKILLTTNNKLLPCERVNFKYSIGRVNSDVELNITDITRRYKFYFNHIQDICQNCYAYRFCDVCIFHIDKLDIINTKEFICEYFTDYNTFVYKMNRLFSYLENNPNDYSQIIENVTIS